MYSEAHDVDFGCSAPWDSSLVVRDVSGPPRGCACKPALLLPSYRPPQPLQGLVSNP